MKNTLATGRIHAKTGSVRNVRTFRDLQDAGRAAGDIFFLEQHSGQGRVTKGRCFDGTMRWPMLEEFNVAPPTKRGRATQEPYG